MTVVSGGPSGLSMSGTKWDLDSAGIVGTARANDFFGADIWAADFDNSGQADLVVGATFKNIAGKSDAGGASIIYGSAAGLTSTGNQFGARTTQGSSGTRRPATSSRSQ